MSILHPVIKKLFLNITKFSICKEKPWKQSKVSLPHKPFFPFLIICSLCKTRNESIAWSNPFPLQRVCADVCPGSIKQNFFAGVLSEFCNSWGFFSQLNRGKQISVEYRNCIQPCWLWAREIVTWQVRACNSPLCHIGCLSESRCCCIFLGLNTESCYKFKREWFVNYVMPVWTGYGNHQLWWFFFIMWWIFLNSPSGTWTLEPASASWPLSGRGVNRTHALHWCRKLQFTCLFDLWTVMIKLQARTWYILINIRIHCISS